MLELRKVYGIFNPELFQRAQHFMSIDQKVIKRVSHLAKVHLEDEDAREMATQLTTILTWVEQLNEVNTDGVAPLFNVNLTQMPVRDDEVTTGQCPDQILSNAPEAEFNMFVVPKVVE